MNTKKIIMSCLIALMLLCFVWLKNKNNNLQVDLVLSNIEALASYENGEGYFCFGTGSLDCPDNRSKVTYIGPAY